MVDESAVVEKKLAMSLDELIAEQKKKQGSRPKAGAAKKKAVPTKTGGKVLVVPRPKHVPRPSPRVLKGTRNGGVQKGGPAPKFMAGGRQQQGGARQVNRVKVTIGNKSGRGPSHLPTSGVLAKPFGGASGSAGGLRGGRAPMQLELPRGAPLSARFDTLTGEKPSAAPRGNGPRRNAHGVLIP